jgi:hypothetical protein
MRKVTIQYKPFEKINHIKTFHGNFPSTWDETSPKQLIAIACLMKQSISDVQFLVIMTGLSKKTILKLDDYQRFQLIELFDSFQSGKPYNEFIIENVPFNNTILVRPKPKLKGVTFGQFIYMDTHFIDYQQSSDAEDMNQFIAATYLPEKEKFHERFIEDNQEEIENIDLLTREAIVINYHLIRDWLSDAYPLVFQKKSEEEKKETEKDEQPKKRNTHNWINVFDGLVGDDIVNEDNYSNLPLHSVLRNLSKRIKSNAKNK